MLAAAFKQLHTFIIHKIVLKRSGSILKECSVDNEEPANINIYVAIRKQDVSCLVKQWNTVMTTGFIKPDEARETIWDLLKRVRNLNNNNEIHF